MSVHIELILDKYWYERGGGGVQTIVSYIKGMGWCADNVDSRTNTEATRLAGAWCSMTPCCPSGACAHAASFLPTIDVWCR